MANAASAPAPERTEVLLAVARRACPGGDSLQLERVTEGASTEVYRLRRDDEVFYLRLLPEVGTSFAPEVLAHRLLRLGGASVPEVVYYEDLVPELQRSLMVVREIPGAALTAVDAGAATAKVLAAAGCDLALVNGLPVEGFGWVQRGPGSGEELRAEYASYGEWALKDIEVAIAGLIEAGVLSAADAELAGMLVSLLSEWATPSSAVLVHGDFDGSHIYHAGGAYSGIIDFGEIRGADPYYDLAEFQTEHPEWLPLLLAGYCEVALTPSDLMQHIQFSTLVYTIRRLTSWLARGRRLHPPDVEAIARALRALA